MSRAAAPWRVAAMLVAAALLFSRAPGRLLQPQLWAEDGIIWLCQAYQFGAASLFWPVAGYLQTLSRLVALLAIRFPLTFTPGIFAVTAFLLQLLPVALLVSTRGAVLVPSLAARLLLASYYIGEPNATEVFVNLTNAMWHLALAALLVIILPKPKTIWGKMFDLGLLVLAGLSGPLILYIAPIAWWQAACERRTAEFKSRIGYAVLASASAALQGWLIFASAQHARHGMLGANFARLVHIIADQVFLGGTIGAFNVTPLTYEPWWLHIMPPALVCLAGGILVAIAFVNGPPAHRKLVLFAALILGSGLASPMVSFTVPQWDPMQHPGAGTRYYIMAMLAWFSTLLVLSAKPWAAQGHWLARLLLLTSLTGVVTDWQVPPYTHAGFHDAAKIFAKAAPGTKITFPVNPAPWQFNLVKR